VTGTPTTDRRVAHLGLGAFHRAHQAWYTEHAHDDWRITAFTGRRPDAARLLAAQRFAYTLIERAADGDTAETIRSISAAVPGDDARAWLDTIADPRTGVLTLTVTEPGYAVDAGPPARIAAGLSARRASGAGAIAIVSCDNLPGNGRMLRDAVLAHARADAAWITENVAFVDTVVDRITPATTPADVEAARELTGVSDPAVVVTEPFTEWILHGEFPAGRPAWDAAGARFVDDVAPYEERKLWLLNAGHTLLAASGRLAGYETVSEAFADDALRDAVEALWTEQRAVIDLPPEDLDPWLDDLRIRFANPRIAHRLDQISRDSAAKVPVRILAPLRRRMEAGLGGGEAQRAAVGSWIRSLLELPPPDRTTLDVARMLEPLSHGERIDTVIAHLTPRPHQNPQGDTK
jgi:fructuronate reductase